jgi:hypothetical protein
VEPRTYQERKEAGICTRAGCSKLAGEESNECPRHQRDSQKRRRRHRMKARRLWAKKRLCLRCGGKRAFGRKWCGRCLVREDRARTSAGDKQRDNKDDRTTDVLEADGYARSRYHGQSRRGQQKRHQLDAQDIDEAIERLQRAKRGVLLAAEAEEQQMPRVQRDEIRLAAMAQAALAGRFVEEILDRNNYDNTAK